MANDALLQDCKDLTRRDLLIAGSAIAISAHASVSYASTTMEQKAPMPTLPVARIEPIVDTYFGEEIIDNYRWMENEKDPEWVPFMKGQAEFARATLDKIPGLAALQKRIGDLSGDTEVVFGIQQAGDNLFVQSRPVGADNFRLTVRKGLDGPSRVLVDPSTMRGPDGSHVSLDWWVASPDGSFVAYGLSPAGSENSVTHIINVATGALLPERLDRAQYASLSWLPDGSGFFLNRLNANAKPDTTDYYKNSQCWLHKLNTDPRNDVLVMAAGLDSDVAVDPIEFPNVFATPRSEWVFGVLFGGVRRENPVYVATLASAIAGKPVWKKVADIADQVTSTALRGDSLYCLTTKTSDRGSIRKVACLAPDFSASPEVVPGSNVIIEGIAPTSNGLFLQDMDGGYSQLRFLSETDEISTISLPFEGAFGGIIASTDSPMAFVGLAGWVKPYTLYSVDGAVGTMADTFLAPKPQIDLTSFQAVRTFATAKDGTKIPLAIISKKNLKADGTNPTLVDAYGSYQISSGPFFNARRIAFLEKGGVLATAGVRGGGEYGREWWLAGKDAQKPNTWLDLIACCEHLVAIGITSPKKLAIQGGSAGGITVGRAMTERPELFGVVVSNVGVNNTLRTETGQNGPPNIPEFGTVKTREGFSALKAMDSVHAVKDGVIYPSVLLTTGLQDPRVDPWQVSKFAARLQAAAKSTNPVLLRVDVDAGHGLGSTRSQRDRETADTYAFIFWRLGVKGWQPI
jgi:prolyl oligopeptidase